MRLLTLAEPDTRPSVENRRLRIRSDRAYVTGCGTRAAFLGVIICHGANNRAKEARWVCEHVLASFERVMAQNSLTKAGFFVFVFELELLPGQLLHKDSTSKLGLAWDAKWDVVWKCSRFSHVAVTVVRQEPAYEVHSMYVCRRIDQMSKNVERAKAGRMCVASRTPPRCASNKAGLARCHRHGAIR